MVSERKIISFVRGCIIAARLAIICLIYLSFGPWHILRYEDLKGGARVAMVVIKHGSIKEEYVATEWLKKVSPDPVLGCFITAVVNAVKPDEGLEAILADYTC